MEKNLEKYLISNVRSLDEWKDIANKSLKDISIEDLYKDYDKDIQKKILYTENDYSKITNFSYSRGIKKDHDENLQIRGRLRKFFILILRSNGHKKRENVPQKIRSVYSANYATINGKYDRRLQR